MLCCPGGNRTRISRGDRRGLNALTLDEWLEKVSAHDWRTAGMGLERMRAVVQRLGLERPGKNVITVAAKTNHYWQEHLRSQDDVPLTINS